MTSEQRKKPSNLGFFVIIAAVLCATVALRIMDPRPIAQMRLNVFDNYQRVLPRAYDPNTPVRIIDIDEETLKRFGQWPWPRTRLGELIERLTELGASAIAMDMVFPEPDRLSPREVFKSIPKALIPDVLRQSLHLLPSNDTTFATATANSRVVLGLVLSDDATGPLPAPIGKFANAGDDPREFIPFFSSGTGNLAELQAGALGMGTLNWVPEVDSVVRRVPIILRAGDQLYPSLVAETLRVAQGETTYVIKASGASGEYSFGERTGIVAVKIGQFIVPTDRTGQVWVHFTKHDDARTIPAWKILSGEAPADEISGRIMMIGASAAGLFDLQTTPLQPLVPGVQAHAQALESIFSNDLLHRPDYALGMELAFLIAVGVILTILIRSASVQLCVLIFIVSLITVNVLSWYAFVSWKWLLDPLYPSLALFAVFAAGELNLFVVNERERRYITGAFGRYLSPDLVARLGQQPDALELGGEIKNMTLLFCDIRGFTQISEGLSAGELTTLINRFLTPMTGAILDHQGTIDKYMGDAIMAFWNAPLDDPDHARHACEAAVDMVARLEILNGELRAEAAAENRAFIPIRIGIGINTGEACVGNMGSAHRFDYSVIGDNVNIASRLEGQSKTYAVQIVIGEQTAKDAGDWPTLELDMIRLVGKSEAQRIFTILPDPASGATYDLERLRKQQASMLDTYRARRWGAALTFLTQCRALAPHSMAPFYDAFEARIAGFRETPPPADWDGAFDAETK